MAPTVPNTSVTKQNQNFSQKSVFCLNKFETAKSGGVSSPSKPLRGHTVTGTANGLRDSVKERSKRKKKKI